VARYGVGPYVFVIFGAVLWGTTGTTQALAPPGATAAALSAFRAAIGGVVLFAWASARRGGGARVWSRPPPAVLLAGVALAAYQVLFFNGVRLAGVAVGTLIGLGSAPVLTGLAELLLRRRRPEPGWAPATLLALLGTALIAAPGSRESVNPWGVPLAVGAGASYTLLTMASKHLLEDGWTPLEAMGQASLVGGVLLAPILWFQDLTWLASPGGTAAVLWLGLATMGLAYFLFAQGLRELGPPTVATLTLTEPVTATTLGLTLLGESPGAGAITGGALVFAGLVIVVGAPLLRSRIRRRAGTRPSR
jgi:DME family drug/metabolite transporter